MSLLKNKTYRVIIQGCRTNQYEGEAIAAALERAGAVLSTGPADVTVVVTCTVTAAADSKCRKAIRRAKRENPGTALVVCGCGVQNMDGPLREALGIDIAVGNRRKYKIPQLLASWFAAEDTPLAELGGDILTEKSWDGLELDHPRLHTRAFLKIQDGCSHFCSYCIVPFVRGAPVCRDAGDAVREAARIAASGCPEIVLTGVHIGVYSGLGELVKRIDRIGGVRRIRFGSIEPFAVDEKLLDALAEAKSFCPHLHLPLQSGADAVLAKMRRGYTASGFAEVARLARQKLGAELHISTDLMVGFPGEDERAFVESLRFVEEQGFGKVHVFPYSPRQGTEAAGLPRPPRAEVEERVGRALALAARLHESYCSRWLQREVAVLVEERNSGAVKGLTPHFVRVLARRNGVEQGDITLVKPEKYIAEMLTSGFAEDSLSNSDEFGDFV